MRAQTAPLGKRREPPDPADVRLGILAPKQMQRLGFASSGSSVPGQRLKEHEAQQQPRLAQRQRQQQPNHSFVRAGATGTRQGEKLEGQPRERPADVGELFGGADFGVLIGSMSVAQGGLA